MKKIKWGIISTANIGMEKVIPAIQTGKHCEVVAISSRNKENATAAAKKLNIPKAYDSYEAILNDEDIDAVYIPLPNHLHIEWTKKCIAAGKHVLCEKPIGLTVAEVEDLIEFCKKYPNVKVMEAFMYRFHPQWQYVKKLVDENAIGELKVVHSFFSYFNDDPQNIRNQKDIGGGGLYDIGCYCISFPRFLFESEPTRVMGLLDHDPNTGVDRIASAMMDFEKGSSLFTCSTQLKGFQRAQIVGTKGRIEVEIPVNAPPDKVVHVWLDTDEGLHEESFEPIDQYMLEGDAFSQAILENKPVPTPLEDALNNMKAIEAIFKSAEENRWVEV